MLCKEIGVSASILQGIAGAGKDWILTPMTTSNPRLNLKVFTS
jgi:hypothetical protein